MTEQNTFGGPLCCIKGDLLAEIKYNIHNDILISV